MNREDDVYFELVIILNKKIRKSQIRVEFDNY